MGTLPIFVFLGAVLFSLGVVGFLVRRNIIIMFLCTELMFQGVILNLIGFSSVLTGRAALQGQVFAVFLIVVAAAEAAMALGLVVLLFRRRPTLDAEAWTALWG
jgi:NADH-quinone oxidoreductase subunit K